MPGFGDLRVEQSVVLPKSLLDASTSQSDLGLSQVEEKADDVPPSSCNEAGDNATEAPPAAAASGISVATASSKRSFTLGSRRASYFSKTSSMASLHQKKAAEDNENSGDNRCEACGLWYPKLFRSNFVPVADCDMPDVPTRQFLKALFEGRQEFFEKAVEHLPDKYERSIPWRDAKFLLRWSLAQAGLDAFSDPESLMRYAASAVLNKYVEGFFAPPEVYMVSAVRITKEEKMASTLKKVKAAALMSRGSMLQKPKQSVQQGS